MFRRFMCRYRAKFILILMLLAAVIIIYVNTRLSGNPYHCSHLTDVQEANQSERNISFDMLLRDFPIKVKVPIRNVSFDAILRDYKKKLNDLQTAGLWKMNDIKACEEEEDAGSACMESHCPEPKHKTPEETLKSVMSTMSNLNDEHLSFLTGLFPDPPTHKRTMFVTAASSNHFGESQGLIRNLHQNVFPLINNYTFVYYDLGLLSWQRKQLQKHCRCEVRSFPLEFMPSMLHILKCYTWKPVIVQANLPKADILVWMDASVRFSNNVIKPLLDDVELRGMVLYPGVNSVAQHTLQDTIHYMQEDICTLAPVLEHQATFLVFQNELLIREAVVKPWVACAMSSKCMCPRNPYLDLHCNIYIRSYNKCHRFDQSAINIIIAKLFRDHTATFHSTYAMLPKLSIMRDQCENYFYELERENVHG